MINTIEPTKTANLKCPKCGLARDYSRTTFVSDKAKLKQTYYKCGSMLEIKQFASDYKSKWRFNCNVTNQ